MPSVPALIARCRSQRLHVLSTPRATFRPFSAFDIKLLAPPPRWQGWLAVFGGDIAIEADPDLGLLMKRVKTAYGCKLLAVQSWGEPDKHVDYFFRRAARPATFGTSRVCLYSTGDYILPLHAAHLHCCVQEAKTRGR